MATFYLRQYKTPKGIRLSILERFYDPSAKRARERKYKTLGYVEDLKSQYDDPIAFFTAEAEALTAEVKSENKYTVTYDLNKDIDENCDLYKNVGYGILKRIYKELEIDKFWKSKTRGMKIQYDADKIFQFLVYSQILYPASKKKEFENKDIFFEDFGDFSLDDIYSAMDIYSQYENELQTWIYDHSITKYSRDLSVGYFDCTNYYFDISRPDLDELDEDGNIIEERYRKRGPEKNHRPDPIVEMGLLMDKNGIPLAYNMFPGNSSEKINMLPIINRARLHYGFGRIIIIADRGLNTADNIYYLNGDRDIDNNKADGYIYGQSVRGADKEFKDWVLDQNGYIDTPIDSDDDDITEGCFRHKSRIVPKTIEINVERKEADKTKLTKEERNKKSKQKKIKKIINQKQLVYYSQKYANKQKYDRSVMIERAKDLISHPKKYDRLTAKGATGYVLNITFDKESGEVIDKDLVLDEAKIAEEEKYDGYYAIVSSELDMGDMELRENYRGLIEIENTFKICKSDLDLRPIRHRLNNRIDAHFEVGFTALVILKLLQAKIKTDQNYNCTVAQLKDTLKKYGCVPLDKSLYMFIHSTELLQICGNQYDMDFSKQYRERNEIRRMCKY